MRWKASAQRYRLSLLALARPMSKNAKDCFMQSRRGVRPIETAPTAALPINVSTTRRERFMERSCLR